MSSGRAVIVMSCQRSCILPQQLSDIRLHSLCLRPEVVRLECLVVLLPLVILRRVHGIFRARIDDLITFLNMLDDGNLLFRLPFPSGLGGFFSPA